VEAPVSKRAIVLAGGKGTRLAPYTTVFPKPLMPLGETPILEIILRQLASAGLTEVTLAVGYLSQLIQAYFGDGGELGLSITYSRETEPLGTAGPLKLIGGLDDPFVMMNGDVLTTLDYRGFLDAHIASGAVATISTFTRSHTVDFGVIETDGSGIVTGYSEKPKSQYLVSMGVNAFSPEALEFIGQGERLDVPDLILRLISAGKTVRSVPFEGYWLDVGRHDDFAVAAEEFQAHKSEFLGRE
jgi:NDP-sugar pyrophosphorylase family protein